MAFVVSGFKVEDLIDEYGATVGQVKYNPHDIGIIQRYQKALPEFGNLTKIPQDKDYIQNVTAKLKECLDMVFGAGFYDRAFKNVYPLATQPQSGLTLYEDILQAVLADVNATIKEDAKQAEKRRKKYLDNYEE